MKHIEYFVIVSMVLYFIVVVAYNILGYGKTLKSKSGNSDGVVFDSSRLSFDIINYTDKPLRCVLFGASKNLFSENHGSSRELTIRPHNDVPYSQVLLSTIYKSKRINQIAIKSTNEKQVDYIDLSEHAFNDLGQSVTCPIRDYIRVDKNTIEINDDSRLEIAPNLEYSFTVLPKTTVVFSVKIICEPHYVTPVITPSK